MGRVSVQSADDVDCAMTGSEWQAMRAGFTVQGPYRRQSRRVGRWLLAFAAVAALIAWRF